MQKIAPTLVSGSEDIHRMLFQYRLADMHFHTLGAIEMLKGMNL